MLLDRAKDTCERVTIQAQQHALVGSHANTQRTLHVVQQGQLTEVLTLAEGTNAHQARLIPNRVQLEAVNLTRLDNVEIISIVTLLDDEFVLQQRDSLEAINKFELLELVQLIYTHKLKISNEINFLLTK